MITLYCGLDAILTGLRAPEREMGSLMRPSSVVPATQRSTSALAPDVDICGHACRFPESGNSSQFWSNLINGKDMVTKDNRRWPAGLHDTPARFGKLLDISSFDATFFSVHGKQAQKMDPQLRKLLEVSYEAWIDSGIDHVALRGSNQVGVYVGCCGSEIHAQWLANVNEITGYEQTGCTLSMFANRLSFSFDFQGPSKAVDTACSSSFLALHDACVDLQRGRVDYAMVGGASALLRPATTVAFNQLHMVSPDGACKSFDAAANGYARAEGIAVVVLRRSDVAGTPWLHMREPYAKILGIGTNNDGYTDKGITFPSGEAQRELGTSVCNANKISRSDITYVEAHGTGTVVGDAQELAAIDFMYGAGAGRTADNPLLIGSVKSNMGHCEGCSGLAALIKVCMAYERGTIPGNLHFNEPNPNNTSLTSGVLKVVTEPTEWKGGLVAISNFGFGGSNVHCILGGAAGRARAGLAIAPPVQDANAEEAKEPLDLVSEIRSELIIPVSARTLEGAEALLRCIRNHSEHAEALSVPLRRLANKQTSEMQKLSVRGSICNGAAKWSTVKGNEALPVWFVFSGNGSQWSGMGAELLDSSPVFRAAIDACAAVLEPLGVHLHEEFRAADGWKRPKHAMVGLTALQVGLVDVLREEHGITPAGCLGHSSGEIVAGYADGCLTREQTVLVAYHRGRMAPDAGITGGLMAAAGLSAADAAARIQKEGCTDVVVGCDNSPVGVTLSGPADQLSPLVAKLAADGVFTREVDTLGIAYHSPALQPLTTELRKDLEQIIPEPKPRSKQWLSTCYPQASEDPDAQLCGVGYQVQSFVTHVRFTEATAAIPKDAVLLEVGPHALLRAPLRQNLPGHQYCHTMKKGSNAVETVRECATDLWRKGAAMQWPVPADAKAIELPRDVRDALVSWNHSTEYKLPEFQTIGAGAGIGGFEKVYDTKGKHAFLVDHNIDGRVLMPATSYVCTAWEAAATRAGKEVKDFPVEFQDVQIHQAVVVTEGQKVNLGVQITPNNRFFVLHAGDIICEGFVRPLKTDAKAATPATADKEKESEWSFGETETVPSMHFYNAVSRMGLCYGPQFRMVQRLNTAADTEAQLRWDDCFIRLLDGMLQVVGFTDKSLQDNMLKIPTRIRSITIPHPEGSSLAALPCTTERVLGTVSTPLATIMGLELSAAPRQAEPPGTRLAMKQLTFVPYGDTVDGSAEREQYSAFLAGYLRERLMPALDAWEGEMPEHVRKVHNMLSAVKDAAPEGAELKAFLGKPCNHMARLIRDLCAPESVLENLKNVLAFIKNHPDHEKLYTEDPVMSHNLSPEALDTVLDVVLQNMRSGFTVLEVMAGPGGMNRQAFNFLNEDNHCEILKYTCADVNGYWGAKNTDKAAAANVQFKAWDLNSPAPEELGKGYDLVMACNTLHTGTDIAATLAHASDVLAPGGFLCAYESTSALPALLWGLAPQAWAAADERDFGLWCSVERWEALLAAAGFDKVMLRKDAAAASALMLYRKKPNQMERAPPAFLAAPSAEASNEEVDDWLEEYRTKFTEMSGMKKLTEASEGAKAEAVEPETEPAKKVERRLWVHADLKSSPGAFGLFRTAYHEGGDNMRLLLDNTVPDELAPVTGIEQPFERVQEMLAVAERMDLSQNVFQDGTWGTLRMAHVSLKEPCSKPAAELEYGCHMDIGVNGDLSTLYWRQNVPFEAGSVACNVTYGAMNFKDVMLAYGKLDRNLMAKGFFQGCLGFEFSGTRATDSARHIMGVARRALATRVCTTENLMWDVPSAWSLKDAATVPVAYMTAYYALLIRGALQKHHTVLVHSGTGAVGMAAIRICHHRGCEVFTTCSNQKKRNYLQQTFPFLDDAHIGDSRSTSFEALIKKQTNGRGVDLALNSLADDKLTATVRCIAPHGHLLEIGKYDILKQTGLSMRPMHYNISFQGVDLDNLFLSPKLDAVPKLHALLKEGIASGEVQPLPWTVFARSKAEEAFRYLAQGVHMGKVLVQIADTEGALTHSGPPLPVAAGSPAALPEPIVNAPLMAKTVFTARPDRSYLLIGGLGGLGLAFAAWLAQRGARHLILSSKRGLRSGHQADAIAKMESLGVNVTVSTLDVVDLDEAKELIALTEAKAPLAGIFNLALNLDDRLMAQQTGEAWNRCVRPKAIGSWNLDAASRGLRHLDHFVFFSSIVATQGNAGQTSYGFANMYGSELCRARRVAGLPALAIGWGPIGNVGVMAEADKNFGMRVFQLTAPQPVDEVLQCLGDALSADQSKLPVIMGCSRLRNQDGGDGDGMEGGLVAAMLSMLGLEEKDVKDSDKLASFGVDSMQLAEIRSRLQRAMGRPIPLEEVGEMTFGKLRAIEAAAGGGSPKAAESAEAPAQDVPEQEVPVKAQAPEVAAPAPALTPPQSPVAPKAPATPEPAKRPAALAPASLGTTEHSTRQASSTPSAPVAKPEYQSHFVPAADQKEEPAQEVEEVEAVSKGDDAKTGLSMATEKSFAFGAARKPGSPPATADSVTSLHPWTGRSNGGSYSPRSTSPPTGSPAPSEADLAQERSPAGGLLQAHMFEVIAVALALMVIANMALILVNVGVPLRLLGRAAMTIAVLALGVAMHARLLALFRLLTQGGSVLRNLLVTVQALARDGAQRACDGLLDNVAGRSVFLVDFHVWKVPDRLVKTSAEIDAATAAPGLGMQKSSRDFIKRVAAVSGITSACGVPEPVWQMMQGRAGSKERPTPEDAKAETEMIIYDVVSNLLQKTDTKPKEIDAVIVSCSCYAPNPSMAAMLVNKFGFRKDVLTFNLSGMGCSTSVVCVDMAKRLFKATPNMTCLIVNHENTTWNYYTGRDRAYLLPAAIFRMGGAAVLMSNRPHDAARAKYELKHTVRTHLGSDDEGHSAMGFGADLDGKQGMYMRKHVIEMAQKGLVENLKTLKPLMTPTTAKIMGWFSPRTLQAATPNMNQVFKHLLLYTGGRGVLDAMQQQLRLSDAQMVPSRETLFRFGNTSSASTWYTLANIEQKKGVTQGDKIFQVGFGGGFKCNTAVWRALRDVEQDHSAWDASALEGR
ncbi:hypothetical protein CVIRNUC_000023 [Coccomyxa viridis]|uniref:Fatty acid synthase n=1 Tax=Coccomyxa viridis TaxID=1274662 RepID=A0AAV1HRY9_9CHLO|nr:hypothetical protein CVIRNUC_000023 [Coccomyxa viridis]